MPEIIIEQGDGIVIESPRTEIVIDDVLEQLIIDGDPGEVVIEDPTETILIEGVTIVRIQPEPDFTIDSFGHSVGVQEIGATVATPAFTASYSDPPDLATLTDDDGTPPQDVTSTPGAFSSAGTFSETGNNASVVFTLAAEYLTIPDSAVASIVWRPRTFWGIGGASLLTEAQVEALAGNALDNNRDRVFAVNASGPADYVWYCFPQSYDPTDVAQFQVGAFPGGFAKLGVVSVTNPNGVTQDYAAWRSDFPALGSITVTVT